MMTPTRLLRLCAFAALCSVASMRLAAANPIEGELLSVASSSTAADPGPATTETPAKPDSATESSKMSRFLDDFTSAFKQGTAKMKESLENAASSVKDGVLQGYDYVRSKLTGMPSEDGQEPGEESPAGNGTVATGSSTAAALTSSSSSSELEKLQPTVATSTSTKRTTINSGPASGGGVAHNEPVKIVPNDDDDDERIIFESNDKDYVGERTQEGGEDERDVTESPPVTTSVTLDNRFIIASPLACKSGQEVVNGKCRNVY